MILVFGATGTVGREVVAELVDRGEQVRAFVRDPGRCAFGPQVELVKGDLDEPHTLPAALHGVDGVFMVTSGPDALAQDIALAGALRAVKPRRVAKLSSITALPPVHSSYGAAHAEGERVISEAGPEWTVLRPASFMSNVLQWIGMLNQGDEVYASFGEIPRAMIAPRDIAKVAVKVLTSAGHAGRTYALTGPEALTVAEQVDRLATAIGRPVRFVGITREDTYAAMIDHGIDPALANGLLDSQADTDPERGGRPLPTVEQITGHPPQTFDSWLAEHAHVFGQPSSRRKAPSGNLPW